MKKTTKKVISKKAIKAKKESRTSLSKLSTKKVVSKPIENDATNFNNWLKASNIDKNLKDEIKNMSKQQLEFAFAKKDLNFGTAGIRGIMGPGTQQLNKFVYQQMSVGYAKYILSKKIANPTIVIGHDNRLNSDVFALECQKVCNAFGINVILFEKNRLIPTPILSYTIMKTKACGGINITASHNPKEYNGFKAYNASGSQILPDEAKIIIDNMPKSAEILNIEKNLPTQNHGQVRYLNYKKITNSYFDEVEKQTVIDIPNFYTRKNPIFKQKIVFTGHSGTTSKLLPCFLKRLGFKKVLPVKSQCEINPYFNGSPISNPEDSRSFEQAIHLANIKKANIMIGVDPDGDRMAIGFKKTNRWRFLNGNELGIVFTHYLLKYVNYPTKPYILSSWVSTNYIDRIAKKYGANVYRTKTGFKWMCNLIDGFNKTRGSFALAFEEAIGSLVHTVCRDKDCFGATLLALQIYADQKVNFNSLDLHDYLRYSIYKEFGPTLSKTNSYTIKSSDWVTDANKMMKNAMNYKAKQVLGYKITKIFFDKYADAVCWQLSQDSWIRFRISGTEPKFKIYFCLNDKNTETLKEALAVETERIEKAILGDIKYVK